MAFMTATARDYDVTDFGAKADTTVLSTAAIQSAIDACWRDGGGTVVIPAGDYKTGSLQLRSHVHLRLHPEATLYGSRDLGDYQPMKSDYVSLRTQTTTIQLIYADRVTDVKIQGGTIDGRGSGFPKLAETDEGITRPHLIRFIQSDSVEVSDITLRNAGCWMQHYLATDHLYIHDQKVFNRNNYNNDALDIDGCHDVVVRNMEADSDDDGITLKSTSPRLCERVRISDCTVSSHCNSIKLGTETNGGFRDIDISRITVRPSLDQSTQFYGRRNGSSCISLEIVDGGVMDGVRISDVRGEESESAIFIRLANRARSYAKDIPVEGVGSIRNILLENITVVNAGPTGSSITGMEGHPVENVTLRNVHISQRGTTEAVGEPADEMLTAYPEATMWGILPVYGFYMNHCRNIVFDNCRLETSADDPRPMFVRHDCQ